MTVVLVVNDERDLMEACAMALEALGYEVIVSPHMTVAAKLAREKCPDVVLLDLVMPGMMGEEVLHKIREQVGPVPVVVMSASDDGPERAKRMGAEAFLTKPFGQQALGAAVQQALQGARAPARNAGPGEPTTPTRAQRH
ncbi:MAG TPA: response regulator [Polyangiaceae bacterium]|jgi:DNA-binding response OmpR family regulator